MCLLLLSQLRLKLRSPADRMNWLKREGLDKARFERNVIESQRSKYLSRLMRSKVGRDNKYLFNVCTENKTYTL